MPASAHRARGGRVRCYMGRSPTAVPAVSADSAVSAQIAHFGFPRVRVGPALAEGEAVHGTARDAPAKRPRHQPHHCKKSVEPKPTVKDKKVEDANKFSHAKILVAHI